MTIEMKVVNSTVVIITRSLRFDIPGMNFRLIFGSLGMLHPLQAKLLSPSSDRDKNLLWDRLNIRKEGIIRQENSPA